ncbi:MAG: cyclic pyranopterin monophosphate synthase MoaC [Candidatus Hydrogenedentes bacterium]|nr:cyclic pyranopterin monophosphate synthase MoaC [Candidatus Hydrogenedentota bacterium]
MLSHLDASNQPIVVDVSEKAVTRRTAHARSEVVLPEEALSLLEDGEIQSKKGPVFQTAILAGIMAAKKTSELIPLCHPIPLEDCKMKVSVNDEKIVIIDCRVTAHYRTGVEMEALTGASVAALTIYDMCKAVSHDIVIRNTRLIEKRGGKSDYGV